MTKFVWCEYVSPNPARAQAFFRDLLGWTTVEASQGGYTMLANAGRPIGGYVESQAVHWQPLLQTWNIEDSIAKLTSLGGKVCRAPFAVGAMGREAVVEDPLGGVFALWQPAQRAYDGVDFHGIDGGWVWYELSTEDPDAALAFYKALGGFDSKTMTTSDGGPGRYEILESEGRGRGGIMKTPGMPPRWKPYVQVADTDAIVDRAKALGATIQMPGETVPGVGRLAVIVDPLGAPLGLLKPSPM